MNISISKEISKPAASIFPLIEDPEKAMQWQHNVKGAEILKVRPEIIGTTFKETVEEGGKSFETDGIITQFVTNKLIGYYLINKIHQVDICYHLTEFHTGT